MVSRRLMSFIVFLAVTSSLAIARPVNFNGTWVEVEYWAGSGSSEAIVVVDFEATGGDSYAFGFRWDGSATAYDALVAIDAAGDLDFEATYYSGWGYFIDNFYYNSESGEQSYYWQYFTSSDGIVWTSSWVGMSDRVLTDGSWDGWYNSWDPGVSPLAPVPVVDVDIEPRSCPNPLNVDSRGVLPVAILGSEDFDVNAIDVASIRLAGVVPIRSSFEDVATPVSDGNECECTTAGTDGYIDLTLKFKTVELVEELVSTQGELVDGDVLVLTLTGVLSDETPIEGADCVLVLGKVPKSTRAKRADINRDGVVNMLDLAMITANWLESTVAED